MQRGRQDGALFILYAGHARTLGGGSPLRSRVFDVNYFFLARCLTRKCYHTGEGFPEQSVGFMRRN